MKWVYLVACVVGTVLPWSQFGPWLLQHGLAQPPGPWNRTRRPWVSVVA